MAIDGNTLRELAIKVSQYFLDFLESDFKRQQAPRRRIVLQTDSGFRSGMRIAPYPELQKLIWQLLQRPVDAAPGLKFLPRTFSRPITPTLRGIIQEQIAEISNEAIEEVRRQVIREASTTRGEAIENPEYWVDGVRARLASEVAAQVVRPLLALLDGPLSHQAYSQQDSIYSAETELVEIVAAPIDAVMPEMLSKYLATGDGKGLEAALGDLLTVEGTQEALTAYFEAYVAADAYLEFRDLETYATTGENLQLYLYVGSLKFANLTFPIFYIPVDVERLNQEGGFRVNLQNHLYTNKHALDFVLQELAARQKRQWLAPVNERITYLTPEQNLAETAAPLFRRIANAMDLGGHVDLDPGAVREAGNTNVSMSTALHFAVADRADEALLNDYEEMISQARKNEPGVVELFEGIVQGVLLDNPVSLHRQVEDEWDRLPLVDRVVIDSPVPLNEEQIKILAAIRNPTGKIVVVEGPPGTGKSHTITAIAADAALRGASCLILSDKTEALDVVQNKLSDAMNQARHDSHFPNPILRLGQGQANFKRLTSNQVLTQVSAFVKANRANHARIEGELNDRRSQLKGEITGAMEALGKVQLASIADVYRLEDHIEALAPGLTEVLQGVSDDRLAPLVARIVADDSAFAVYVRSACARARAEGVTMGRRVAMDAGLVALDGKIDGQALTPFQRLDADQLQRLGVWILQYQQLRMPIFGYLFRGAALRNIELQLNTELSPKRPLLLKKDGPALVRLVEVANDLRTELASERLSETDFPEVYAALAARRVPPTGALDAREIVNELAVALQGGLPAALEARPDRLDELWMLACRYLQAWIETSGAFRRAPDFDYVSSKSQLERLNVSVMNAEVDKRLVSFMENFRSDAKTLAAVIANRQKFPADKFESVKESFPVILASIRQFGEYMPLVPDLFDVVVIDEASQVSVAQAFPALLRAKKVVVLGDSKQFSNTKSSNASISLNEKYRSDLEGFFRQRVSQEASMLHRLAKFDVKCSILEFCQLCANYSTMLRKHFRSYQELISYSSSTFYGDQLQAIKIRAAPLDDVIRFDLVEVGDAKVTKGTNEAEAEFILDRILDLLDEENPPTVGVITPFRDQQILLTKKLFGHARGSEMQDRLRLKVMTFDSCQGEERKIIFYSMVATAKHDSLNYVFPVELGDAQETVEEKLKQQRLNVGFSRAEELVWFVHSKPIDAYKGSIAKALQHFSNLLQKGEVKPDRTDPNSPMERSVLDWLQKTAFYQRRRDHIEILPQFPIGQYLRQLDPTYQHPAWRVDFLLTFSTEKGSARIVIEYDGFDYHFQKGKTINVGNHDRYLVEADIERQLTLESYGYRFLRINRFNLGKDPVETLSQKLETMVERLLEDRQPGSVDEMQQMASGLAAKELKPCSRCHAVKPMEAFFDKTLKAGAGGHGRVCTECKAADAEKKVEAPARRYRRWGRRG